MKDKYAKREVWGEKEWTARREEKGGKKGKRC